MQYDNKQTLITPTRKNNSKNTTLVFRHCELRSSRKISINNSHIMKKKKKENNKK